MKIDLEEAVSLLKENDDFLILTHANPDGDTIGSGFALMLALQKLGKRARVINNGTFAKKFDYLTALGTAENFTEKFIVSVDVADIGLLGDEVCKKYSQKVDLAIDHHGTNTLYAKRTYIEPDSASACEILFLIIEALGIQADTDIADCLFTGCSTDTGCFRFSNVTARTHIIAAKLIEMGARHAWINNRMFDTKTQGFIKLEKMCLDKMEFFFDGQICVLTVMRSMLDETGCDDSELDAIVAMTRQIEGVKAGITIKEKADGGFKASLRTSEDIDASAICAAFGGGGHKRAAGCSFDCSAEQAKEKLVRELEKSTKRGN